jgi:hypothetical protein
MDRLLTVLIGLARTATILNILTTARCSLCGIQYDFPSGLALQFEKVLVALLINKKFTTLETHTP